MNKWPNAGDLPVERARQVCSEYRLHLLKLDPELCGIIDEAAIAVGETWVNPELAIETHESEVTVSRAAEITGRSTRWVYKWISRDPTRVVRGSNPQRVILRDVLDAVAYERSWRAKRTG